MDPIPDDRPWSDLAGILTDDIINKFKVVGQNAYPHQYEFIKYCLGQPINQQNPIIGLRSQTGSGKTLCFQALIYSSYKKEIHAQSFEMKELKQRDNSMKLSKILYPYSIVLGQTVYLKQHEENFVDQLPERLKKDGMKFQTFFALTKDKQFNKAENKIEETDANVILCHPSKLVVAIKMKILNVSKLKYLIIDEADQLLEKSDQNQARNETAKILSFLLGQTKNQQFQIIFVSASLKQQHIDEFVRECVQMNFDQNKQIDPRFIRQEGDLQEVKCDIKMLPSNHSEQIAPYTITHMYLEPNQMGQEEQLVQIIKEIYSSIQEAQIMIFFNQKAVTQELNQLLQKNEQLHFIVKEKLIADCTGDTNQDEREKIRKQFMDGSKKILLCTDVLQRGLDFRKVRVIIHYGLPYKPDGTFKEESYFQRSGRTGRAKDEGVVLSILLKEDMDKKRKDQLQESLEKNKSKIMPFQLKTFIKDLETVISYNKEL